MKKIIKIFLATCFCFLLISCSDDFSQKINTKDANTRWSYIKSPNTGKCYEIIIIKATVVVSHQSFGYMGMSEITCDCMPSD